MLIPDETKHLKNKYALLRLELCDIYQWFFLDFQRKKGTNRPLGKILKPVLLYFVLIVY